jgi:hypothetical protein
LGFENAKGDKERGDKERVDKARGRQSEGRQGEGRQGPVLRNLNFQLMFTLREKGIHKLILIKNLQVFHFFT